MSRYAVCCVVPAGVCGAERRLAQLRLFSVPTARCVPGVQVCPGYFGMVAYAESSLQTRVLGVEKHAV